MSARFPASGRHATYQPRTIQTPHDQVVQFICGNFDFHWFSLISIDFHWFSLISIDLYWFSLISIDFHWFSLIFNWFSLIFIDFHLFLMILIDFHWFLLIFIDFHWFSLIFMDSQRPREEKIPNRASIDPPSRSYRINKIWSISLFLIIL